MCYLNPTRKRTWQAAVIGSILVLIVLGESVHAQLSHEFIMTARNTSLVHAAAVAAGPDGKIFLANAEGGVRLYCCEGASLTFLAESNDVVSPRNIALGPDGTVFVAAGRDGLHAYRSDGASIRCIASIHDDVWIEDVAAGSDGIVYVACSDEGLRAYRFSGTDLVRAGHIDDVTGSAKAQAVSILSDGTIILSTDNDGLRAYRYARQTFTPAGSCTIGGDHYRSAALKDGTLFLASGRNGVQVYRYDKGQFTYITSTLDGVFVSDVIAAEDGSVYAATDDGLCAYTFNGRTVRQIARRREGVRSERVRLLPDNTILSCGEHGLRRYSFLRSTFQCLSQIAENTLYEGEATDACISPDGTIFLANGSDGIYAYEYTGHAFRETAHGSGSGAATSINVGADNLAWVGNDQHELECFRYTGTAFVFEGEFASVGSSPGGDVTDVVFPGPDQLCATTTKGELSHVVGGEHMPWEVATAQPSTWIGSAALGEDGTIFVAGGREGLFAYRLVNNSFVLAAHVTMNEWVTNVALDADGTIFSLSEAGAIRAFEYTGTEFICTAHADDHDGVYGLGLFGLAVGPDGTVFVCGNAGLYAYEYTGTSFVKTAESQMQGTSIAVRRDGTLIIPNLSSGLFSLRYASRYAQVPQISVYPNELDFGEVMRDQSKLLPLTIRNTGTSPLECYVHISPDPSFRVDATVTYEILPNHEHDIDIACYPLSCGDKQATLRIFSNDPVAPLIELPVMANAVLDVEEFPLPKVIRLEQNVPNPFNPATNITFEIPRDGRVLLDVIDFMGRRVAVLVDGDVRAGVHRTQFEAAGLPSGLYFSRLHWKDRIVMRKMALVK